MEKAKVSSKYQIVIPESIRENFNIEPGQNLCFIQYGSKIELIPEIDIKSLRGRFKGMNTDFDREDDRP